MAATMALKLPHRGPGALTVAKELAYQAELEAFCAAIREIRS